MGSNRKPFIANLLHRYKTVSTETNITKDLPYPIIPNQPHCHLFRHAPNTAFGYLLLPKLPLNLAKARTILPFSILL